MKKLVVSGLFLLCATAKADVSSSLTVASNYIWRGISFSTNGLPQAASGAPVIQGTIDYSHASGFGFGTFVGNADTYNFNTATVERDTETDLNMSYVYKFSDDMSLGLYAFWYNYLNNPSNNSMEYDAFWIWKILRLDISHMPNYFGTKSASNYVKLSTKKNVTEKFGVLAHIGSASFADENKVGYKNYTDHRAGLFYTTQPLTLEIAYTNTSRQDLNQTDLNDKAVTLSATAVF